MSSFSSSICGSISTSFGVAEEATEPSESVGSFCSSLSSKFVPVVSISHTAILPSTPKIQRIYLIRHGESQANVLGANGVRLIAGRQNEVELTAKGVKQATTLGEQLAKRVTKNASQQIVLCSSIAVRAKSTRQKIFEQMEKHHNCILGDEYENLVEVSKGKYEGQPDGTQKEDVKKWDALPSAQKYTTARLQTGESFKGVNARISLALQDIVKKHLGKTIFVVLHHDVIMSMSMIWCNHISSLSPTKVVPFPPRVSLGNCDMLMLELTNGQNIEDGIPCAHIESEDNKHREKRTC